MSIQKIFTAQGYDLEELKVLATFFHITGALDGVIKSSPPSEEDIEAILKTEITPQELNGKLQENYFKKFRGSGERQQINPLDELAPHAETIRSIFQRLGYIDTVLPSKKEYDFAFIFGCAQEGLKGRMESFEKIQEGKLLPGSTTPIKVETVFILAGDRALWPDSESIALDLFAKRAGVDVEEIKAHVNTIFTPDVRKKNSSHEISQKREEAIRFLKTKYPDCKDWWPTEADMAQELAEQMLPGQTVIVVNAEGKGGRRPDTMDTVVKWNQRYGSFIKTRKTGFAVSNQPYIPEQLVALGLLDPSRCSCEVVGSGCDQNAVKTESLLVAFAGSFNRLFQREIVRKAQFERANTERRHGGNGVYNPNKPHLPMTM